MRVAPGAEGADDRGEVVQVVGGLRARAGYEFRVRAHTARGPGPPSRAATAAPQDQGECSPHHTPTYTHYKSSLCNYQ